MDEKTEEKKEEVEPQGQALVKRTCKGAKRTNKIMSLERRDAQCKLDVGAYWES